MGDSSWEVTRLSLEFTGKILLFKNLVIQSDEVFSDFRRVPRNLTIVQGIELLEKEGRLNGSQAPAAGVRSGENTFVREVRKPADFKRE